VKRRGNNKNGSSGLQLMLVTGAAPSCPPSPGTAQGAYKTLTISSFISAGAVLAPENPSVSAFESTRSLDAAHQRGNAWRRAPVDAVSRVGCHARGT